MNFLIVTPNYNSGRFIPETFERMLQAIKSGEGKHKITWIVMDSCSTDESISNLRVLISKYGYHNLRDNWSLDIRVEVKKDSGMYEGINNGMKLAKENSIEYDCFFWLNADDLISVKSLDSIEASIARAPNKLSMIVGRGIDIDEESKTILDQPHPVIDVDKLRAGDFNYTSGEWLKAESCVFPKELIVVAGYFNASLRLAGDYDYIMRCAKVAEPFYDDSCYAREFRRCAGQQSEDLKPYEVERKTIADLNGNSQPLKAKLTKFEGCIYFYPDYTSGNSYQTYLYENHKNKGFKTFEQLRDDCPQPGNGDIFHIHWLNDIIRRDESVASEFTEWLFAFLLRSKQAGARIIWTIHNIHSHETNNLHIEARIYRFLADVCDRCHMHDAYVAYEFLDYYKYLPWGKIRIAGHGAYPFVTGPQAASITSTFGLCSNDQYIVVPGQLRKYKNIPLLHQALKYLYSDYSWLQICFVGQPHPELSANEVDLIYNQPNALFSRARLSDDDYGRLVRDSLFALLTYTNISTSGGVIHALSQGTRVVAPRIGTIQTCVTSSMYGFLYRNNDVESLLKAIDLALDAQSNNLNTEKNSGLWAGKWGSTISPIIS